MSSDVIEREIAKYEADIDGLNDQLDAKDKIIERLLTCGNHIATYRTDQWPDYPLDGLTRDQQCELAVRRLGATRDYDMWCCCSGMMQARDDNEKI